MPLKAFKKILLMLSFILAISCSQEEKHRGNGDGSGSGNGNVIELDESGFTDGWQEMSDDATFGVESYSVKLSSGVRTNSLGLVNKKIYEYKLCLKDRVTGQKIKRTLSGNQQFIVQDSWSKKLVTDIRFNDDNCWHWSDELAYEPTGDSKYLLKRWYMRPVKGGHKGLLRFDVRLNPWATTHELSSSQEVKVLHQQPLRIKEEFALLKSYLSEILPALRAEDAQNPLVVKSINYDGTREIQGTLDPRININLKIKPVVRVRNYLNNIVDVDIYKGDFNVELYVIAGAKFAMSNAISSDDESSVANSGSVISGNEELEFNQYLISPKTKALSASGTYQAPQLETSFQFVNLIRAFTFSNYQLAIRVSTKNSVAGLRDFEGVFRISDIYGKQSATYSQLNTEKGIFDKKTNEFDYLYEGDDFNDALALIPALTESEECPSDLIEKLKNSGGACYLSQDEIVKLINDTYGASDIVEFREKFKIEDIQVKYLSNYSNFETTTVKKTAYRAKVLVKDDKENKLNNSNWKSWEIHITNPGEKDPHIITFDKNSWQGVKSENDKTNEGYGFRDGYLIWDSAIVFKYFQPERYLNVKTTFKHISPILGPKGEKQYDFEMERDIIINPWDYGWTFGYDPIAQDSSNQIIRDEIQKLGKNNFTFNEDNVPQSTDFDNLQVNVCSENEILNKIQSKFYIYKYGYATRTYDYNVDKYLQLEVRKQTLFDLNPMVLRYSSLTLGKMAFEYLRDGIYLLKTAIHDRYKDHITHGEEKEFVDAKVQLVRVRRGEIITPFTIDMKDLRLMRSRADLYVEIAPVSENILFLLKSTVDRLNCNFKEDEDTATTKAISNTKRARNLIGDLIAELDSSDVELDENQSRDLLESFASIIKQAKNIDFREWSRCVSDTGSVSLNPNDMELLSLNRTFSRLKIFNKTLPPSEQNSLGDDSKSKQGFDYNALIPSFEESCIRPRTFVGPIKTIQQTWRIAMRPTDDLPELGFEDGDYNLLNFDTKAYEADLYKDLDAYTQSLNMHAPVALAAPLVVNPNYSEVDPASSLTQADPDVASIGSDYGPWMDTFLDGLDSETRTALAGLETIKAPTRDLLNELLSQRSARARVSKEATLEEMTLLIERLQKVPKANEGVGQDDYNNAAQNVANGIISVSQNPDGSPTDAAIEANRIHDAKAASIEMFNALKAEACEAQGSPTEDVDSNICDQYNSLSDASREELLKAYEKLVEIKHLGNITTLSVPITKTGGLDGGVLYRSEEFNSFLPSSKNIRIGELKSDEYKFENADGSFSYKEYDYVVDRLHFDYIFDRAALLKLAGRDEDDTSEVTFEDILLSELKLSVQMIRSALVKDDYADLLFQKDKTVDQLIRIAEKEKEREIIDLKRESHMSYILSHYNSEFLQFNPSLDDLKNSGVSTFANFSGAIEPISYEDRFNPDDLNLCHGQRDPLTGKSRFKACSEDTLIPDYKAAFNANNNYFSIDESSDKQSVQQDHFNNFVDEGYASFLATYEVNPDDAIASGMSKDDVKRTLLSVLIDPESRIEKKGALHLTLCTFFIDKLIAKNLSELGSQFGISKLIFSDKFSDYESSKAMENRTSSERLSFPELQKGWLNDARVNCEKKGLTEIKFIKNSEDLRDAKQKVGYSVNYNVSQSSSGSFSKGRSHGSGFGLSGSFKLFGLGGGPSIDNKGSTSFGEAFNQGQSGGIYLASQHNWMKLDFEKFEPCTTVSPSSSALTKLFEANAENLVLDDPLTNGLEDLYPNKTLIDEDIIIDYRTSLFKALTRKVTLCLGSEVPADNYVPPHKDLFETYYYFAQHFTEGDMLDPGNLLNHPWLIGFRGVTDYARFILSLDTQNILKFDLSADTIKTDGVMISPRDFTRENSTEAKQDIDQFLGFFQIESLEKAYMIQREKMVMPSMLVVTPDNFRDKELSFLEFKSLKLFSDLESVEDKLEEVEVN